MNFYFESFGSEHSCHNKENYIEKPPFPVRIKDHAKASNVVHKSNTKTPTPPEQIKVHINMKMVILQAY